MKTIGVLGGMGPQASVHFYRLLIELSRARHGARTNEAFPRILLENIPVPDFIADRHQEARAVQQVIQALQRLAAAGADFFVLPCNTMHLHAAEFTRLSPVPFYSIVDRVVERLQRDGRRTVGLLGTPTTLRSGLYHGPLQRAGIAVLEPAMAEHPALAALIGAVIAGTAGPPELARLAAWIDALVRRGAEAVVLGCTELPLLARHLPAGGARLYDCLTILAEFACGIAYGKRNL